MASNSKRPKLCSDNEDWISALPDPLVWHILSFMSTRQALKISVLSHRWNNVWASVPVVDLDDEVDYCLDHYWRCPLLLLLRFGFDWFPEFVNRVLMSCCAGDVRRFCLVTRRSCHNSLISGWISAAIRRNVVELDLKIGTLSYLQFEIPIGIFRCNTLMSLKLHLSTNITAPTPGSNCFPCLKFFHVMFWFPDSHTVEKLFSCFPVLEDLIIDGHLGLEAAFNLDISAPKLRRLQIKFFVQKDPMGSVARIFFTADAPNLEEVDIDYEFVVSYSLRNAKYLRKANICFFEVEVLQDHDYFCPSAHCICQLFADISNAKHLKVSAPVFGALDIRYQSLPAFSNLNHLELQLKTCRCLQSLTTLLKLSPNLEHLNISAGRNFYGNDMHRDNDNEDELEHGWNEPESVPLCLISHRKTICLLEYKGCPEELEVAKYMVKHGMALKKVTIYSHFSENEAEMQSHMAL